MILEHFSKSNKNNYPMSFSDLINQEYPYFVKLAKKYSKHNADPYDVCHSMIVELYKLSPERQQLFIDNPLNLRSYFSKMIYNSLYSPTSPYYRLNNTKFTNPNNIRCDALVDDIKTFLGLPIDPDYDIDYERLQRHCSALIESKLNWYSRDIFNRHLSGISFGKLSIQTGIPASSLWETFNEARKLIQQEVNYEDFRDKESDLIE